jgi:hypothetical protein
MSWVLFLLTFIWRTQDKKGKIDCAYEGWVPALKAVVSDPAKAQSVKKRCQRGR